MTTDWNDPEINPHGLTYSPNPSGSRPVRVTVTARALAFFKSAEGKTYLCAYVNEERKRSVFIVTSDGYVKLEDQGIVFTITQMTNAILEKRR